MTEAYKIAAELRAGLAGVTGGLWESDSTRSDGSYGAGDDVHEGFDAYQVIAPPLYPGGRDVVICDTLNSDATEVAEEWDEDGGHSAWDEQGRKNMAHIARCSKPNILAILDAWEADKRLLAEAVEVLSGLTNDADGLSFREDAIRNIVGNTNWQVLREKIAAARALLSRITGGQSNG